MDNLLQKDETKTPGISLGRELRVTWGGQSKRASYKKKGTIPVSRKGWWWDGSWGWEWGGQWEVH